MGYFLAVMAFCMMIGPLCPGRVWAEDGSGMSLELFLKQNPPEYALGVDPVTLDMKLKNVSNSLIYTDSTFSPAELPRSLIITAPDGIVYSAMTREGGTLEPGPPDYTYQGKTAVSVQEIEPGYEKWVTVDDIRDIFPIMKTLPGWYIIQAYQPFARYLWTVQAENGDRLGIDHPDNWSGTIDSKNKLTLFISPAYGAQLQVQVLDRSFQPPKPLEYVPVKIFRASEIPAGIELAETWERINPVLHGTTNSEGWALKDSSVSCMPEDEYTAIALHQSDYQAVPFEPGGGGAGWAPGCTSTLAKQILFGEPLVSNTFSVFGLNSVWIETKAVVLSGNIGAALESAGSGPFLMHRVQVSIGTKARAEDGVQIFGDSVNIGYKASVYDVIYNELKNRGTIRNQEITPLDSVPMVLPSFPDILPGGKKVTVKAHRTLDLTPGSYGDINIKTRGKLNLTGGTYHFKNLNLGSKSSLICHGPGPTEILIQNRLTPGSKSYVGPSPDATLSAKDVVIYVGGINGKHGGLRSNPKAAVIGLANQVKANIYAPNGTLWIMGKSNVQGSFIAKDVIVGSKTKISMESAF